MKSVLVKGPGSDEFLHRVTAGTVRGVKVGEGRPGLLLTGQSRMIAQFDLLRLGEAEFLLAAPAECAGALKAGLEKLHFAEDLEILPASGVLSVVPGGGSREGGFVAGEAWPSPVPGFSFTLAPSAGSPSGFEFARLGALYPWPGKDWDSNTPALEAGALFAIDRFKGCYPGQEVVELSLNVGHPPRVLVGMEGPRLLSGAVELEGGGQGQVTSAAGEGGVFRALVRVPWAKREQVVAGFHPLR
jgi:folate-binding Fe-S cluster repair protein YgfZ